jgi:hypothetical protein
LVATAEWVDWLIRTKPGLVGQIGRPPTRVEIRAWIRNSEKNKMRVIEAKLKYHSTGFKADMIKYLELRQSLGYIEGVPVPAWLLHAVKDPERGYTKKDRKAE